MQTILRLFRLPIAFLALSAICVAESPRELAKIGFKSVVLLAMNDANGQPLCIGSGFFVSDDIIATNAHVIEGARSGSAKLVGQAKTFQVLGTVAVDQHADLALLKVAAKGPPLGLSQGPMPVVGDEVYVIGNPLGLEGTFSEGIVSGIRTAGADSIIQMTAPISPGSSGGPVMDAAGDVVGVSVATFKEGQNLNLAVPVSYLERMIQTHSATMTPLQAVPNPLSGTSSIIDGLGTRTEEGVTATEFMWTGRFDYQIRLSNKLPVAVSQISIIVIFYDRFGKMLDFDRMQCDESIPAGLTTIERQNLPMHPLDDIYRENHDKKGQFLGKAEMRVIGFKTGGAPY